MKKFNDLDAMHIALVLVMFWLSFVFSLPNQILSEPNFSGFRQIDSEEHWTWYFLCAGLAGTVGLISPRPLTKNLFTFLLATSHVSVAYCFLLSDMGRGMVFPAFGIYSLYAALGYYVLIRRVLS